MLNPLSVGSSPTEAAKEILDLLFQSTPQRLRNDVKNCTKTIADAIQDKRDGEPSLRKPLLTQKSTLRNGTNILFIRRDSYVNKRTDDKKP